MMHHTTLFSTYVDDATRDLFDARARNRGWTRAKLLRDIITQEAGRPPEQAAPAPAPAVPKLSERGIARLQKAASQPSNPDGGRRAREVLAAAGVAPAREVLAAEVAPPRSPVPREYVTSRAERPRAPPPPGAVNKPPAFPLTRADKLKVLHEALVNTGATKIEG